MIAVFPSKVKDATLESEIEPVFGDAESYVIIGPDLKDMVVVPNTPEPGKDCHMAETFKKHRVRAVVSEKMCKHCMENLQNIGIDVWKFDKTLNIRESYNKFVMGGVYVRHTPEIVKCKHTVAVAQD
jgi:predicted Fe-Mo cluster-binding NifX family protein